MDYYQILGVSPEATYKEIKKAHFDLTAQCHPDKHPDDEVALKKFKEVQEAYSVLSDEQKRNEYDRQGYYGRIKPESSSNQHDGFGQSASRRYKGNQPDLDAIQQQFFGGSELQGRNILIHLLLTSQELSTGVTKPVKWKKGIKCNNCDGYGAATFSKSEFLQCKACKGTGNVTMVPGKQGAMYPKCDFCDGSGFLEMYCKSCKGTGITKDLFIEEMVVEVPARTPSGFQIVIRGRGEPGAKGGISGNLHIVIIEQN